MPFFPSFILWARLHLETFACAEQAERRAKEEMKKEEEEVKKEALFSWAETRRSNIISDINAQ